MVAAVWQLDAWETSICHINWLPTNYRSHTDWHCRRSIFDRMATASTKTAMAVLVDDAQPAVEERNWGAPAKPPCHSCSGWARQNRGQYSVGAGQIVHTIRYGCQATKLSGRDARKLTRRRSHAAVWRFPVHNTIRTSYHDGNPISFWRIRYRRGKRNLVTV